MKSVIALLSILQLVSGWTVQSTSPKHRAMKMMKDQPDNLFQLLGRGLASAAIFTGLSHTPLVSAAEYAPATPPPVLTPQVSRQSPKAVQPGVPEKWIYSKFLDQVEKDDVEKVTFSPDGKRAVGVNTDGDRFTVDIPNDPNLLSFLVQHKVEINVAPINANGGTSSDTASLILPDNDIDRLLQVFILDYFYYFNYYYCHLFYNILLFSSASQSK